MQHQFCTLTQHLSLLAYLSLWNILSTHIMSYYKNKTASVSLCYKSYCFKTANIKLSTVKHRSYLLNRLYHLLYLYIYIFIITPHLYHSAVCLKCKTKLQCLEFVDKICKQSCLHKWATTTTALRPLYRPYKLHSLYRPAGGRPAHPVKNWTILLVQRFTARMPLLMATSEFGLGRRCWSSPQQCYLHYLHTLHTWNQINASCGGQPAKATCFSSFHTHIPI